jgi:hypothetical protein
LLLIFYCLFFWSSDLVASSLFFDLGRPAASACCLLLLSSFLLNQSVHASDLASSYFHSLWSSVFCPGPWSVLSSVSMILVCLPPSFWFGGFSLSEIRLDFVPSFSLGHLASSWFILSESILVFKSLLYVILSSFWFIVSLGPVSFF